MPDTPYRTALITGASSGIGRSLARWFSARGVRVYAAARRADRLESLRLEAPPGTIEPVTLDVGDAEATVARVREVDATCGGLDLVIANAGVGGTTDGRRIEWDGVRRMIAVNATGAAATLVAALPAMVERGRGHLVGISSIAAFRGLPGTAAYCGTKAFLAVFLEGLRVDLRRVGVRVTCVHPGFVRSELTAKNDFPMPFLLETDDAADRIARAIVRGKRKLVFPWPIAALMTLARAVPDPIYDALAPNLR